MPKPCEVCEATPPKDGTATVRFHLSGLEDGPGRPPEALGRRTWRVCEDCGRTLRVLMATHGLSVLRHLVNSIDGGKLQ